jgi:hypothetical protein
MYITKKYIENLTKLFCSVRNITLLSISKSKAMQSMLNLTMRRRKSEALTSDEKKAFLKYISSHQTNVDAAESIGISRQVLERVQLTGSGSPETIQAIREKLA